MKKIGILTYISGNNPGTLLQAYSVLSLLRDRFINDRVEIVNYQPCKVRSKYIVNYFKKDNVRRTFQSAAIRSSFQKHDLNITSKPFVSKDCTKVAEFIKDRYDVLIVGSDTVWEIEGLAIKNMAPFPNIYWLPGKLCKKKIAFAVSAGARTTAATLEKSTAEQMKNYLLDFDLIGARDDLTEKLVEDIVSDNSKKNLLRVPDPTFVYEVRETGVKEKLIKQGYNLNKRIVWISLPYGLIIKENIIQRCKAQNLQVLCTEGIADINGMPIDPHEWAQLPQFVNLVITDRFHGTIFSLKNFKPVITIDCLALRYNKDGNSKTRCLCRSLGLEENHFNHNAISSNYDAFYNHLETAIERFDINNVRQKIGEMKKQVLNFLDKIEETLAMQMLVCIAVSRLMFLDI